MSHYAQMLRLMLRPFILMLARLLPGQHNNCNLRIYPSWSWLALKPWIPNVWLERKCFNIASVSYQLGVAHREYTKYVLVSQNVHKRKCVFKSTHMHIIRGERQWLTPCWVSNWAQPHTQHTWLMLWCWRSVKADSKSVFQLMCKVKPKYEETTS